MVQVDWTIHVSDLLIAGGVVIVLAKSLLYQRDFNRDVLRILGVEIPRDERRGLLGDVANISEKQAVHEEWMRANGFPGARFEHRSRAHISGT